MKPEAYTEMAATEDRHWWFRGRRQVLDTTIRRLNLPQQARILELGSGTGGNFAMLARFGTVTAIEMNDAAREISMAKNIVQDIRAGSLPGQLPLTSERFDLICLFDVLEHVEEDGATLTAIKPYLADGGAVIITVPAFRWLWSAHDVMLHHKRRYEKAELQAKLKSAGFVITRLTYANMALFPAALLVRLKDRLLKRPRSSGDAVPPGPLNELFALLFGAESYLPPWAGLPFGLSLLVVARTGV